MHLPITSNNAFKAAIQRGEPQIGLWLSIAEAYTAELCAASHFDWLMIDGEHAPNDLRSVLAQLQAVAPYPVTPVVRPVSHDPDQIKLLLDIGVTSLLVPMVNTAEQARSLVAAMRYPPGGRRGIGHVLARATRWGRDVDYFSKWEEQCCLIVQIETAEALVNLEDILDVDGVHGMLIGAADLAASLGYAGELSHPEVIAAIDDAIVRTKHAGSAAGVLTTSTEQALSYFAKGCSFVAAGVDVLLLSRAADSLAADVRAGLKRS